MRGIRLRKLLAEILSKSPPQSLDSNPNSLGSKDRDLSTLQDPLVHTFPAGLVQGLLTWMSSTYLPPPSHLFCFKTSHTSLPGLISPELQTWIQRQTERDGDVDGGIVTGLRVGVDMHGYSLRGDSRGQETCSIHVVSLDPITVSGSEKKLRKYW